jgi:uncharacterized protein
MPSEFIGRGWAFPLRTDPTGSIALVGDSQDLEKAIRLILGTAPGERPMRPEFGCAIHDEVFAGANAATATRMANAVRVALVQWEPRIEVLDVDVTFEDIDDGVVYIHVGYQPTSSNDPRNLVFPFYVIPGEPT